MEFILTNSNKAHNNNTTGVAQDLLEEHVKKGFLKGGKYKSVENVS